MLAKVFTFRSISTRFIVLVIFMVVLLFGGVGVFIAGQNADALRASLKSKSDSVADLASKTGADYLSTFNFMAMDHLVEDIVVDREVAFAGFYNDKNELVTKLPVPQKQAGLQIVERELKDSNGAKIGTLKVGYKLDNIKKSQFRNMATVAAATILAIVLFSLGIAMVTRKVIINPLRRLGEVTMRISNGDLSQSFDVISNDELGVLAAALNTMVANLNRTVTSINAAAAELSGIATHLADVTDSVSNAVSTQAVSVDQTSSAIVEIDASIKGVAKSIEQLSLSASETSSSVLEMSASVSEVATNAETLNGKVADVSSSITQMAAAIKQVEQSVVQLQESAAGTSASVIEMDTSIKAVERNAAAAAAISDGARVDAETGRSAVEASIDGIKQIKTASEMTSAVIRSLSDRASAIGSILSVIDEVAGQTNLLALNAAIIAAQAGEQGKGFAVVADEIKQLAERTTASTKEIAKVITAVQEETAEAVKAINMAERSIASGKDLSEKSGEALRKIYEGVQRTTDQMREIASSTLEQSKGSHMIREAMEHVSEMVAQIVKATKEQSEGSELIMASAETMKQLTEQVRNSTFEQTNVATFIAKATDNITGMIGNINRATMEQSRGSGQIANAMETIQSSAAVNLDATKAMNEVVAKVFAQIEILREQMRSFTV